MKVMCINNVWHYANGQPIDIPSPSYGEVCVVIEENDFGYKLEEYPENTINGWVKTSFIPCSDIDETEMVREKELVN